MAYIYFVILLLFLVPYSLLITWQLYTLVQSSSLLLKRESEDSAASELPSSLRSLMFRRQWFDALQLLELQVFIPNNTQVSYFYAVGVIYNNMHESDLSELYFTHSLSKKEV